MRAVFSARKTAAGLALIALAGLAVGVASFLHREAFLRKNISASLRMFAISITAGELAALTDASAGEREKIRDGIEQRMDKLRDIDPSVRKIELLRCDLGTGKAECLARSDPPDPPESFSGPGDDPAVFVRPELLKTLAEKKAPVVRTPLYRFVGHDVRGYVHVAPSVTADGARPALDIVRYEVDGRAGFREMIGHAGRRAMFCFILLGLPFCAYAIARRSTGRESIIESLRAAVDQCENAIMIAGLDGRIIYANDGLVRQTGYSRDELFAMKACDLDARPMPIPVQIWEDLRARGFPQGSELVLRRKNGGDYPARMTATAVRRRRGKGGVFSYILIITDMAEHARRSRQIQRDRQAAENASRAKGAFLAMMSHEVRTPLNGILGFSNLLLETDLGERQRACVADIARNGEILARLSADILELSRIESGSIRLQADACDPRVLIGEMLGQMREMTPGKALDYAMRVDAAAPREIVADSLRLRQILANCALDAARRMGAGKIEIAVDAEPDADAVAGMVALRFSVRGFPAPGETHAVSGGSSLGLTIARHLVELMGGRVVENSGDGATPAFVFSIRFRASGP